MFQFTDTKALSEDGAWVHIKDGSRPAYWPGKDGKPDLSRPVRIKVYGPHSETFKDRARKRAANLLRERGGGINLAKMSAAEIEAFIEQQEDNAAAVWADRTMTWENVPGPEGEPLAFSHDAAASLYAAYPSVLNQLAADSSEIEDFWH
ncbi:hypothetical protein [Ponticoccus litoralis]|uniref:Uncharacterized protein n=1 Tax=Ponticoccus litoralis TaxID=422297 RepID=A0AAW9SKM8_9RHOB